MATSTQLAQALALKKQNPNLTTRDAALQVKQATTPVTPTTPTPPQATQPVPTQNFPSQPLAKAWDVVVWAWGEKFIQANNYDGSTNVQWQGQVVNQSWQALSQLGKIQAESFGRREWANIAPIQSTTPTTPAPTTPAPTAPVDKTAEIQAKNQAQMEANAQKSQLAIDGRKKAAEDARLANIPTDQKSILTSLISWVSVPQQNTAAYRNANLQYKNYQKFNAMTPQQLLDNMKMGEIDTATSQLLANNPSYIKAKEDFDKFQKNQSINQMVQSVTNGAKGTTETVDYAQQASDSLAKKLGIDQTNAEAYATIVSKNPEVVQLTKTVSSITKQLNTLNTERNAVYADLKSQYPDLSASAIMTLMASRTKQATDQIDALNSSLTLTSADLKTALEMAKWEYEATKEDIALQAGIAKEQRATQAQIAQENRAKANEKPTFQQYGDKVYQVINGKLVDTGINTASDQWQSANITRYNPLTGANESTPIFYKKKSGWAGFEAVDLSGNPIDANLLWGGTTWGWAWTLPSSFTWDTSSYIASKEWFRDKAYQDSAWVWTIWYGTTRINGKPVQPWMTISQQDAQKLLEQDIASHSTWKTLIDESTLSDSQKTALASFEYNLWPWIWNKSAMNIIDMIKSWNLQWAAEEMKKYNTAGWKVIKWLTNRRNEEASLLMNTWDKATTGWFDSAKSWEYENYFKWQLPAGMKKWTIPYNNFIKEAEAYRETVKWKMTPDQLSIYNSQVSRFTSNPVIKSFEEQYSATQNAVTSLSANSWAGDIAWVYQFMKALDPTSTVREWEFNTAASSAGVIAKIWNAFTKLENWEILSDSQKEAFKSLMLQYLKTKSTQYDRIYEDMVRPLKNAGIDESNFPTKATIAPVSQSATAPTFDKEALKAIVKAKFLK